MIQLKRWELSPKHSPGNPSQRLCMSKRPSPKTNTQWGTRTGDKAGWTAKSLNSLLSPSKSHTFPTISPSVSISGFTCDIYSISCRGFVGWIWKHNGEVNTLNDCSQLFQTSVSRYAARSPCLRGQTIAFFKIKFWVTNTNHFCPPAQT